MPTRTIALLAIFWMMIPLTGFAEVATVTVAKGDGSTKVFGPASLFDRHDPKYNDQDLVKGSVAITDGKTTFKDNGTDGTLTGGKGSGFIDYPTAFYYVLFTTAPSDGAPITATFEYKPANAQKPASK